jgi:aspartate-semialdehyde dehydrogenase
VHGTNVGIVGATGQVGQLMLRLLVEREFPVNNLRLFASANPPGRTLTFHQQSIPVEDAASADPTGLDIVLFSAGKATSQDLAEKFAETGAVVIDNSPAWRMHQDVPLVVAGVNDQDAEHRPLNIIANPNCTTMIAMPPVAALHEAAGLASLTITTFQAVSGSGRLAPGELLEQVRHTLVDAEALIHSGRSVEYPRARIFPGPIAHNVIPFAGTIDDTGETSEEAKLRTETRKILSLPDLPVSATCVRVPVLTGHSLSINARFEQPITPGRARSVLMHAHEVALVDTPTPLMATGGDTSLVGRIRKDETVEHGLAFFVSGDNLRKGAALNAVQLAELVVDHRPHHI